MGGLSGTPSNRGGRRDVRRQAAPRRDASHAVRSAEALRLLLGRANKLAVGGGGQRDASHASARRSLAQRTGTRARHAIAARSPAPRPLQWGPGPACAQRLGCCGRTRALQHSAPGLLWKDSRLAALIA